MEQVKKNDDLIRLIYSFGYPEHRTYMNEIVSHFDENNFKIENNIKCIRRDYNIYCGLTEYPSSLDMFITDLFSKEEQHILLKQMLSCRCCSRHSHSKPHNLIIYCCDVVEETSTDVHCHCSCRHLSRCFMESILYHRCLNRYKQNPVFISPSNIMF